MPNHCDQQVHIHGPRALVLEIYHRLNNSEPRFCDVIKPMPFEIYAEPSADSVDADYQDEGDMFEGTWLNGSGKTWQPEYEEDENGDVVKILREDA